MMDDLGVHAHHFLRRVLEATSPSLLPAADHYAHILHARIHKSWLAATLPDNTMANCLPMPVLGREPVGVGHGRGHHSQGHSFAEALQTAAVNMKSAAAMRMRG